MVIKRYSAFPKAPAFLEPRHQILLCLSRTLVGQESYPSAEKQSVYSKTPTNWVIRLFRTSVRGLGGTYPSVDMQSSSKTLIDWEINIAFIRNKSVYTFLDILYIYIYCHPETDCFVLSRLFSVASYAGRLKLGSKPAQLYVRLNIIPLSQQAYHVS